MESTRNITFADLFAELDEYQDRIPLELLVERLKRLQIDWEQIQPNVRFAPDTYRRNLLHAGKAYHALILCWRNGQRSPIHDHRGSSCAVRVLRGMCSETLFERTASGHIFPTTTHQKSAGSCCGSQDADIHQISNLASGDQELITLHIYSPPLLVMGQYSLTNSQREEVAEPDYFLEGAGI